MCHLKKELQVGYPPYPSQNMALPYTKAPSETHCVSDMAVIHHTYLLTVSVAVSSMWNMPSAVQEEPGLPSIRHNEIRDITASLMSEVCHAMGTEPCLQPVTEERLTHRTANREEGARLDIVAQNFWGRDRQSAFFDVRVFNPYAPTYRNSSMSQCYRRNEQEKKIA